jgi:hypothetical protein
MKNYVEIQHRDDETKTDERHWEGDVFRYRERMSYEREVSKTFIS